MAVRWPTGANKLQQPKTFPLGETCCSFKNDANTKTQIPKHMQMKKHLANLTKHAQHLESIHQLEEKSTGFY